MGVTNFLTLDGEIISETRNGIDSDYIPDMIGSTCKLVNMSMEVTDTFDYWPYGEVRSHVGTSPTQFGYVGTRGYATDPTGLVYIKYREFAPVTTAWMSVDRIWPRTSPYGYALGNPIKYIDPNGLQVMPPGGGCVVTGCNPASNNCVISICLACNGRPGCQAACDSAASAYYLSCHKPTAPFGRRPGSWTLIPGVGVVPPSPLPPFLPVPKPPTVPCTISGPPDCGAMIVACEVAGTPPSFGGAFGIYNLPACTQCCAGLGAGCSGESRNCLNSCISYAGLMFSLWPSQFGGPSGAG